VAVGAVRFGRPPGSSVQGKYAFESGESAEGNVREAA
jgi:hypothetical protein